MNPAALVIAIDGPSAAGKGTLGRRLALHYDLAYLDTGLLYRAVGAALLRGGSRDDDEDAAATIASRVTLADLEAPDLRDEAVAQAASQVAAMPSVRKALLALQRRFIRWPPPGPDGRRHGVVVDGRDIGAVVCPQATAKLFVTAGLEDRARRRHKELLERGVESIYARVLQDMTDRDARDSGRPVSPLAAAPDALVIDSSRLDPEAAFAIAVAHVERAIRAAGA